MNKTLKNLSPKIGDNLVTTFETYPTFGNVVYKFVTRICDNFLPSKIPKKSIGNSIDKTVMGVRMTCRVTNLQAGKRTVDHRFLSSLQVGKQVKKLTFGSLFAGIGGFDLGLERAGFVCKWQVELDPYARSILAKHWPNVHRWDDVRTFPQPGVEKVDVICGGFPCQDISYAGKGAGLNGERSGLWSEFARILREMEPKIAIVENVSAILTRGLDSVLGTLAAIGFDAEWTCLPATLFGLTHNRDRFFLVAYSRSARWKAFVNLSECSREGIQKAAWFRGQGASVCKLNGVHGERVRILPPPGIRRMDDGVSSNMDRLRGLGNAVVPAAAEYIGRKVRALLEPVDAPSTGKE